MWKKLSKSLSRVSGASRSPRHRRPGVESLEGRLVPATIFVNTFADTLDPNPDVMSLRKAITLANLTPGPDTIRLQAGTYPIRLPGGDNTNVAGDFDVSDTLTIIGASSGATAIE